MKDSYYTFYKSPMKGTLPMKIFFLIIILFGCSFSQQLPSTEKLLKDIETISMMSADVTAKVVITQQKTEQGTKVFESIYYRRDSDNSFLIFITAPESEKGNGYLRMGDNFWMYRKNTRTFQHINRDESIAGSDAKGDDFESRKLTELYTAAKDSSGNDIISQDKLGQIPVYRFEVVAKVNDVDYPKKLYWVQQDKSLVLKEQAYSSSNTLMQTSYYLNYTEIKNRFIPIKMIFIDEFEKGNKTIVDLSAIRIENLSNEIFTKAYLENLSK